MVYSTTERDRMECCDKCQYVIVASHVLRQLSGYCQYVIVAFLVLCQVSGYCQYVIVAFLML
jgi:ribosomal protein S27AE